MQATTHGSESGTGQMQSFARRGWRRAGRQSVGASSATSRWHHDLMEGVAVTVAEAIPLLRPPIGERALRDILRALTIPPCGRSWTGTTGRPADLYDWGEITRLHGALAPWLDPGHTSPAQCA